MKVIKENGKLEIVYPEGDNETRQNVERQNCRKEATGRYNEDHWKREFWTKKECLPSDQK